MKRQMISRSFRLLLAAAAMLFVSTQTLGQDRLLYEAFRQAWLEPCRFDEFVAQNQPYFDSDAYHAATLELKDYFQLLYPRELHQKALRPENFGWHARSYVWFLKNHPGAGVAIFLTDLERVAYGRDCWEETCSGKVAIWLQGKREQNLQDFLRINEKALEAVGPENAKKYIALQRQADLEPLLQYLDIMETHLYLPSVSAIPVF